MSKARQLADLGNVYDDGALSNRNLIINGAMVYDQRNSGSSVAVDGGGVYTLDRWRAFENTDGDCTVQRVADAPSGFINSAKVTITTADASLASTQQTKLQQRIEGYNVSRLALGTSSAKTFTLSFWVKSSISGTYSVGFINSINNRSYVDTYSINSSNTWEYKTITLTGDTSGTWEDDNNIGLNVQWSLGMGSAFQASTGSWQSGEFSHASGSVDLNSTLNATFQITGVQLEVGDTATPFEHRSYGDELARCQRYYVFVERGRGSARGSATGASQNAYSHCLPVEMRAVPTCSIYSVGRSGCSFEQFVNLNKQHVGVNVNVTSTSYWFFNDGYTADAEL